jgi:hypothetical protein
VTDSEILPKLMRLAMDIELEATERKRNTVAHLPLERQYQQGRADAARAILALWAGLGEAEGGAIRQLQVLMAWIDGKLETNKAVEFIGCTEAELFTRTDEATEAGKELAR